MSAPGSPLSFLRRKRQVREVLRWLDDSEACIAMLCNADDLPVPPPFPRDLARKHPKLAVEGVLALLRAVKAWDEGGDAAAVFEEHSPCV